ncbi:MAG: TolC family protein [Candidatus Omnitrophica bacterium]|nr:TolC family protein [Candidatus Omnitrophota bacterium]
MKHLLLALTYLAILAPSGFGAEITSLTWTDCIREASQNNPDLISAQKDVEISTASKNITRSSLLPQISANASASRTRNNIADSTAFSNSFSYGASVSQLIFDGAKTIDSYKEATQNLLAAKEGFSFSSSTIRFNLRSAFIDLMRAQELINVTENIAKIRKNAFDLISLKYESGLEHKGSLLNAEASMEQAYAELKQAKRNLELKQMQLNRQMGRPELNPIQVTGIFSITENLNIEPDLETLVKNHPSVKQSIAKKNAAEYGLKSAYGGFFPTISASGNGRKSQSKWPPEDNQLSLGITASIPIFEGGLQKAQVDQAKSSFEKSTVQQIITTEDTKINLKEMWNALQNNADAVKVQETMLAADEERAKIAEAQYSVGFMTYDNWTIIEDNLVQTKKAYLDAQANALLSEAAWINAKGEVLEYAN